jgi:hypothetical protein
MTRVTDRLRKSQLFWSFLRALVTGHGVDEPEVNTNLPGNLAGWDDDSLRQLIDEGRRQIDRQAERFTHTTDRAQILLGIGLVVIAFGTSLFSDVRGTDGLVEVLASGLWLIGTGTAVCGTLGAGSVIVARAVFANVDSTHISTWSPPVLAQLARDYAQAVITGENTLAARVQMLRSSTRVILHAAVLLTFARVASVL